MELLTMQETCQKIQKYVNSREWWVIIPAEPDSMSEIALLEKRFYSGEANRDFAAVMIPSSPNRGPGAIFFGRKSRTQPLELSKWLRRHGVKASEAILQKQDVLLFARTSYGPEISKQACGWVKTFGNDYLCFYETYPSGIDERRQKVEFTHQDSCGCHGEGICDCDVKIRLTFVN